VSDLYGQEFHLRTDHSALTWLMSYKKLEGHDAHWIQGLQEYNFTSEHRQGHMYNNDEALFDDHAKKRVPTATRSRRELTSSWHGNRLGSSAFENRTTERPGHRVHYGGSRDRTGPRMKDNTDRSPTYKSYWDQWKSLAVRNCILECH
jgi:hypothetical protein